MSTCASALSVGPGCSSFGAGAFLEHGPFKVKGDNLVRNEYNWNKGILIFSKSVSTLVYLVLFPF